MADLKDTYGFTVEQKKALSHLTKKQMEKFKKLSRYDQKKILRMAENITRQEYARQKFQEKQGKSPNKKGSSQKAATFLKQKKARSLSSARRKSKSMVRTAMQPTEIMAKCIASFMGESGEQRENAASVGQQQTVSNLHKPMQMTNQGLSDMRKVSHDVTDLFLRNKQADFQKQKAKISFFSGRKEKREEKRQDEKRQQVKSMGKKAVSMTGKIIKEVAVTVVQTNAALFLVVAAAILIMVIILIPVILLVGGSGESSQEAASAQTEVILSAQTESYRPLVIAACAKYDISPYVDLALAVIEQESGGNPPDVMQAEQSYYNKKPPIDSAEESIDCGVHELSDCLKSAGAKGAGDLTNISLALQAYNFGNGYLAWARKNYQGYTKTNAEIFSAKMCKEKGYSSYGDVDYVPHVLRYYKVAGSGDVLTVSNKKALKILKELENNNQADPKVWAVIEKGASLIGNTTYSMSARQADGRETPSVLDCSSFTAWCFAKNGFAGIPFSATTATFRQSLLFKDVSAKDLQVGDIGLKSKTAGTGGANHVGIYCGKLKNGSKVWLHCTSSSSTSLTGNTSGAMFGAYTNFTYFRRFRQFE